MRRTSDPTCSGGLLCVAAGQPEPNPKRPALRELSVPESLAGCPPHVPIAAREGPRACWSRQTIPLNGLRRFPLIVVNCTIQGGVAT